MGTLDNLTERNFFHRACVGEGYVERMIAAGNRAMLVDGAEISVVVEEDAAILNRTESHNRFLVLKMDPQRIIGRHRDFVMGVKPDEIKWRLAGSVDDSLDIGVGDANDRVAAAVAATGATKL